MTIKLIACISSNSGIGMNDGRLLFHIKEDMQNFKKITKDSIVVCGRKTFDSIIEKNGKPLPDRVNVVLTRNKDYTPKFGEFVFHDVEKILKHHETMGDKDKCIYVIGGAEVYRELLPYASEVLLTIVNKHVDEAEILYPMKLQESLDFIVADESEEYYTEKYDAYYKFVRYVKDGATEEGEEND